MSLDQVTVRPMTAISGFEDMHEDICATAADKRTAIIILPFHKYQRLDGTLETTTPGFRMVNQKVLQHAPCSVAILIDRGVGGSAQIAPSSVDHSAVVFFFGGPDDREALAYGCRMVEHPGIKLHVIRFVPNAEFNDDHVSLTVRPPSVGGELSELQNDHKMGVSPGRSYHFATNGLDQDQQRKLDEEALGMVRSREKADNDDGTLNKITYEESSVADPVEAVLEISRTNGYDLILVGRSRRPTPFVATLVHRHPEYPELGPIGDALIAPQVRPSVLVFQQHDPVLATPLPISAELPKVLESSPSAKPLTASSQVLNADSDSPPDRYTEV